MTVPRLVTCLRVGDPSPSYTATFNSLEACQQARAQLFAELKCIRADYEQHWKRMAAITIPDHPQIYRLSALRNDSVMGDPGARAQPCSAEHPHKYSA